MSLSEKINALARTIATDQIAQDIDNAQKFSTKSELTNLSAKIDALTKKLNAVDASIKKLESAGYITAADLPKTADFVE